VETLAVGHVWVEGDTGDQTVNIMIYHKFKIPVCFIAVLMSVTAFAQKTRAREDWIALFNKKDLANWHIQITGHVPNENFNNTFVVDSGILKINYDKYTDFGTNFGHIYYKTPYSYYILKAEYRFVGSQLNGGATWNVRNSGIMIHSQPPETLLRDQQFPVSLEAQFLGGLSDGKPRTTNNLCTPGTMVVMDNKVIEEHCINSTSKTYDGDQWVAVEVRVYGDSLIQHVIDNEVVLAYSKPRVGEMGVWRDRFLGAWGKENEGKALTEGYIALQAESHPIHFRKVELLNLKGCMNPKCKNYRPYYVKDADCACKKK
jgi:hypothetical protein